MSVSKTHRFFWGETSSPAYAAEVKPFYQMFLQLVTYGVFIKQPRKKKTDIILFATIYIIHNFTKLE